MDIITKTGADQMASMVYKQHNAITAGRYDFTACQLDILFMVLASLKKDELNYTVHISDVELITGRKWNIKQLSESTQSLLTRMFEVETVDKYRQFVLFQYFDYIKGKGAIELKLAEVALPYFFDLKNNFTHFQLKSVLDCSSKFAKRLYMLACQWRTVGNFPKPIPILELKQMLGMVDKKGNEQFERLSDFKKFVLDTAKTQINEHTDIHFDYELFKKGRSFTHIQILVNASKNKPEQLEIDFQKDIEFQKNVRSVMAYELSQEHAELIVKDGYDKFLKLIEDLNNDIRQGKKQVNNSVGYLVGVYKKKGVLPKKQ